jgi:hypothetical protein
LGSATFQNQNNRLMYPKNNRDLIGRRKGNPDRK